MKKQIFFITILILFSNVNIAQSKEETNPKIVLITLDGLRWQELFTGADSLLVSNNEYVKDAVKLKKHFWRKSSLKRRQDLMPFIWKEVVKIGQIHGNRNLGSKVDLTNKMWFSYPGYNEILSGIADDKHIKSNDKINNPNKTILELVNAFSNYKGKVAAFGSWDVFPYIINEERSGVLVNAGFDLVKGENLTQREQFLNELQPTIPSPWGSVRLDAFTHHYAIEHMKKNHPELIYIAYGETDDFAHDGDYAAYLESVNTTDNFIKQLWEYTQEDVFYKNNTIFLITTDHGRGTEPLDTWKSHGIKIKGAGEVWFIAFGKNIDALGEISYNEQLFSNQIAPTILKLLDEEKSQGKMYGKPLFLFNK